MSNALLLKNLRIIDPSRNLDETGTIIVENGLIVAAGQSAQNQGAPDGAEVKDCTGLVAVPGLVDARVFVGEPGGEYRETIRIRLTRCGRRWRYLDHHHAGHRSCHRRYRAGAVRSEDGARQGTRQCPSGRSADQASRWRRNDRVRPSDAKRVPSASPMAAARCTMRSCFDAP